MPKHSPQPALDLRSNERPCELMVAELALHQPCIAVSARSAEAQRLLSATIDQNRNLTAHVCELEAELRRRSAELAKLRGELRGAVEDALTDPLTGLANRRLFDLELTAIAARASNSAPAHLLMADIDHFKRVNDGHGHDVGDDVLRIVGEILLANVRRDTLVARVGGDEFGLLLPGASPHYTAEIAIRLCEVLASRPLVVRGHPEVIERLTLSIGVAGWHGGESSAQWYARADAALYQAKRGGRNRVAIATRQQTAPRVRRLPPRRRCDGSQAPAVPAKRIASTVADAD